MSEEIGLCIGLFGTCDKIRWRDPFMQKYDELGIKYFNPMVDNWHPGMVPLEAEHLKEDPIILFPVLALSYGLGSLSEIGFGPLKALRQNKYRSFVILVDDDVTEELKAKDEAKAKDSLRSRKLVKGHLKGLNMPNVYLVETLEQMLETSLKLHGIHSSMETLAAIRA